MDDRPRKSPMDVVGGEGHLRARWWTWPMRPCSSTTRACARRSRSSRSGSTTSSRTCGSSASSPCGDRRRPSRWRRCSRWSSAIEGIGNAAIDITRIVTHRLGIPGELIADLSNAEEVSHRVWIREGSHMAHRPLAALELPVATGMRVMAIRRDRSWITEIDGDLVLLPGDVLFLRGSPAGLVRLHELAAAPTWDPPEAPPPGALTDLDRAVDVLVEMKNISEAAVGLAYSALALRDAGLAAEVEHLADRLDEMKDHLQLWVLRAGRAGRRPVAAARAAAALPRGRGARRPGQPDGLADRRGPRPAPGAGDGARRVRRGRGRECRSRAGSTADGASIAGLQLEIEPGFHVLAVRRATAATSIGPAATSRSRRATS